MEVTGIDVGERWQDLGSHLAARARDTVQPFLTMQYVYGLARAGRVEAEELLESVRQRAAKAAPFVREVWRDVALPACEGLYAHARGDFDGAWRHLGTAMPRMMEAGGSHAQRDLFELLLLDAAIKSERLVAAQQMLELRRGTDPDGVPVNSALRDIYAKFGINRPRRAMRGARGPDPFTTFIGISVPNDTVDSVFKVIEGRREELVDLTRELIRFPTINPPGEAYRPCAEYLGRRLQARGFTVDYIRAAGTPGDNDRYPRINVVARREGSRPGPCVHFNSHIDVVQTGAGWTLDPFAGVVKDGKVFGRGACDMKGGLAASLIAVETLIDSGADLPGALEISGTVDEESGGYGGVHYLAERGWFSPPRVHHVIIPEPLNVDRVCIGHRGVWWAEIETHGRIAHGSMPFLGDCAVRHMNAVIDRFERDLYPKLLARHTDMPVVPSGARHSTLNINSIHGGAAEQTEGYPSPCVPDSCRMIIDRRLLIEESLDSVKQEIVNLLEDLASKDRPGFKYSIRDIFEVIPTMADRHGPVASARRRRFAGSSAANRNSFARPAPTIKSISIAWAN
jgi:succinyl-diaminopimelate desuccinylase